jgi:hypothetical protein
LLSPTPQSSSISSLDGNNFRNPTTCAAKRSKRRRSHYLVGCMDTGLEIAEDSGKRSPVVLKGNPPVGVERAVVHCCVPLRRPSM